jgi:Concanavalin A-like lectin/glucanases superfamily
MGLILPRRSLLLAAPAIVAARSVKAQWASSMLFHQPASGGNACTHDPDFADVSLLCHFDQSNGATTLVDSSSNAQAVLGSSGAAASTAHFEFGTASLAPGGGNTVPGGAASLYEFGAGNFTIECWAYWDGTSASNLATLMAFFPGFSGTEMWILGWNRNASPATLSFQWTTDGTNLTGSVATSGAYTPTANTWVSYAVDRSGNTFRLYVNGAVVGTTTASDTIYTSPSFGSGNIGNSGFSAANGWTGYIDEVRYTKGVARYAGAYTPATCPFPNSA